MQFYSNKASNNDSLVLYTHQQMHKKIQPWPVLKSEKLGHLKLFECEVQKVRNPYSRALLDITVLSGNDSVNVVALTAGQKAILINQYRFGIGAYIAELPGGMVDDGEDHLQAAKRELREETGYEAPEWHYLGCVASNPVFMDSYVHHYLALNASPTGKQDLEPAEDIELLELPVAELKNMLHRGKFLHPHTVSGVLRALVHLEQNT